ncbi:hypothetical protein MAR_012273, partial [Mya arenaria]
MRLEHISSSTPLYLVETNPESDNTALKSTSLGDVNEQNTNINYENKDSSNMDTMEKEFYTWSSWASTKSEPDIPFFVVALHSRQKERVMELAISEGDCLKVVEDYGDFYGVQVEGKIWLIPKDCAKVFDKVPIPLPGECAESADDTYTYSPPLPERAPVDALKLNDTTVAATDCDDECYNKIESPDLQVDALKLNDTTDAATDCDDELDALKLNDTTVAATDCDDECYKEVESPDLQVDALKLNDTTDAATDCDDELDALKLNDTTDAATDCDDECYKEVESPDLQVDTLKLNDTTDAATDCDDECYKEVESPDLQVDALKLNDTTDTATDSADDRYEEVESPDVQDTVDEEVCTHGSLNEILDIPPIANAFKKTEGSRVNNVKNAKCTRQLSSSHLLKDSLTLDDVIHADWKTVKEGKDRLLEAKRLAKEELEQLKAVVNLKNNISEIQCQKIKLAKDFASADERFKLHRESIKGVQGGNFDHFEPESEYLSEGLYSAEHMNRMENTSRDL